MREIVLNDGNKIPDVLNEKWKEYATWTQQII